jgi:hypothetical protein
VFDLMGISLDASPRAQGIARYKSKFGGDFQPTLELRHPAP